MTDSTIQNSVNVWIDDFPNHGAWINKYDRGHTVILAAPELMGATRLAASACSRIGAGLVTVLADVMPSTYRIALPPDIMVKECALSDLNRVNVLLGGPGGISSSHFSDLIENELGAKRVIDAGALCEDLFGITLDTNTVLTPHDGEFERMFGAENKSRTEQTIAAARRLKCIIVRKGPETVIAHPDGRTIVNFAPNPFLAKAGTGDVLSGFIAGLITQGMDTFKAAAAAVWIHTECADRLGPGLTSFDLEFMVPEILRELWPELDSEPEALNYTNKID